MWRVIRENELSETNIINVTGGLLLMQTESIWDGFGDQEDDTILQFRKSILRDINDLRQQNTRQEKQAYYKTLRDELVEKNLSRLRRIEPRALALIQDSGELDYPNLDYKLKWCSSENDKKLWRYFGIVVPNFPNHGVKGRQMKYLLYGDNQVIGAINISSSPMSLALRDPYIGWTKEVKEGGRLQNVVNMQGCVSLYPFSIFVGGKLLALLATSNQVRGEYNEKYPDPIIAMATTSIYGKSIQYDRLSDPKTPLADWKYLGESPGTRTFSHVRPDTRKLMYKVARSFGISHGDFTSECYERDKILGAICKRLGLVASVYLETRGAHKRGVYFCPMTHNWKEILVSPETIQPEFIDRPVSDVIKYWLERWFARRWDKYKSKLKDYDPSVYRVSLQSSLKEWFA